jgi:hypothetical protein
MLRMPHFTRAQQRAADALAQDLDRVFGARLRSLVLYQGHQGDGSIHSCALVDDLAFKDLTACLPYAESWHRRGVAVPLLLSEDEFHRTIDVFPLEYAGILADYTLARGVDPFTNVRIDAEDVRRACEAQAKSHLIHLREAFLESHAETTRIARLIVASAAPLRTLLTQIARLPAEASAKAGSQPSDSSSISDEALAGMAEARMGVPAALIKEVLASSANGHSAVTDPSHLLARYIDAAKRIWEYVDRWRQ